MKKRLIGLLLAIFLVLSITSIGFALDPYFTKNATDGGTGMNVNGAIWQRTALAIIAGDNNAQVIIGSISLTSDLATASHNCHVYDKEDEFQINTDAGTGATEYTGASGGRNFDAGDIVILSDAGGDNLILQTVATSGPTTIAVNVSFGISVTVSTNVWTIYEMESIGVLTTGAATATYESDIAVVAGEKDSPVLLIQGGTALASINFASGMYR